MERNVRDCILQGSVDVQCDICNHTLGHYTESATLTFRPRDKQRGLFWLVSWPWHFEEYQMKAKEIF